MSKLNIVAFVVIAVVIIGGAASLHLLDTGQGNRTSPDMSAKAASD
jgi:hypothetical protein